MVLSRAEKSLGSFAQKNSAGWEICFVIEIFCIDASYWYLISSLKVLQEKREGFCYPVLEMPWFVTKCSDADAVQVIAIPSFGRRNCL